MRLESGFNTERRLQGILEKVAKELPANYYAYLQAKIKAKQDFAQSLAHDDGSNTREEYKRLGIFIAHEHDLPDNLLEIFEMYRIIVKNPVLELHLPPQEENITPASIRHSFNRVGQYLLANQHNGLPSVIYGITYFADLAQRWGFHVFDIPESIKGNTMAARYLQDIKLGSESDGLVRRLAKFSVDDIKLCVIDTGSFLGRFGR